jgi:hypothetical protein
MDRAEVLEPLLNVPESVGRRGLRRLVVGERTNLRFPGGRNIDVPCTYDWVIWLLWNDLLG